MVEVTRHNFQEKLTQIKLDLKKCAYYAIDCEFTFLPSDSEVDNSFFDGGNERYNKIKDKLDQCVILQVGVTPFIFNRDLNHYKGIIYRFYVCPNDFGPFNQNILFKSSTVRFLCDHKFDFNKGFYDGITCLNKNQAEKVQNEIKTGKLCNSLIEAISYDEYRNIVQQTLGISNWINTSKPGQTYKVASKRNCNNYNYLLHEEIRRKFPKVWTYQESEDVLLVKHITTEERKQLENICNPNDIKDEIIDSLLGFSKVYQLMIECKKPMIGHNLYIDLLIMYHQFYKNLPGSFSSFKYEIHSLFPFIFDTKFMSYELQRMTKKDILENNSLGNLYGYYRGKSKVFHGPEVIFEPGIYANVEDQHMHDAGWDSYATGFCFIKMCNSIALLNTSNDPFRLLTSVEHLQSVDFLKNRINIPRASISHLRLDGSDPKSTRPPLLFVETNSKREMDFFKLNHLLSKYGNIHKKTLTPFSALLAAPNFGSFKDVLRDFRDHKDFRIEKYTVVKHNKVFRTLLMAGLVLPAGLAVWFGFTKL